MAVQVQERGVAENTNQLLCRGYTATKPSVITKWPAATSVAAEAHTITIAEIVSGIMTSDPTADRAWTLPTAALAVAGVENAAIGDTIDFVIINTGTASADEIITIAADTGGTLVGSGAILTANPVDNAFSSGSGLFRLRFTGVASGSEAFVVYRLA